MKTLLQKIHYSESESFACRYYRTPDFETSWHMHPEYELIVLPEGYGTVLVGDYVGAYDEGDAFFIAGNLPHAFKKQHEKMKGCSLAAQFDLSIFGENFLQLPEMKGIQQLLQQQDAIKLTGGLQKNIREALENIANARGYDRIQWLLKSLQDISQSEEIEMLSHNFTHHAPSINPAIETVFAFSLKQFKEPISLAEVAALADMSVPAFCRFFKKNVKKTYFDFLQELRIGHACKLLHETDRPVTEVCYQSGFNSWAHFSKKFKQLKYITPSQYRKNYRG